MEPDTILQSHVLDIIFDNKNKTYGAYELRMQYNNRLLKALSITLIVAGILASIHFLKTHVGTKEIASMIYTKELTLQTFQPPILQPKKIKSIPIPSPKKFNLIQNVAPVIVPDKLVITTIPTTDDLKDKVIGTVTQDGILPAEGEVIGLINSGEDGKEDEALPGATHALAVPVAPLHYAEEMPEFPGGSTAFLKFMHKNLKQPGNLDAGDKIVVQVRFVVDINGNIKDIAIVKSGGDLDSEVVRVVSKMPQWKPGLQNGQHVPVYFTLPVTFLGAE